MACKFMFSHEVFYFVLADVFGGLFFKCASPNNGYAKPK